MENSFFKSIQTIILRDVDKLEKELMAYPDDASIWKLQGDIKNSAGTLTLHLCGNLQHYIGVGLGNSDYKRDRDAEFSTRDVPKQKLIEEIHRTKASVQNALSKCDSSILEQDYRLPVFDYAMTNQHFLIHLAAHLGYHLGQVNYHRRLTTQGK